VVESPLSGFYLMDYLDGVNHLVVVDTVQTGALPAGTVLVLDEDDFRGARGASPHYVGLFEAVSLARVLGMSVPRDIDVVAVEAADLLTVGAPLSPPVERALEEVLDRIAELIEAQEALHPARHTM
jgi:hydrogenase maturation protease